MMPWGKEYTPPEDLHNGDYHLKKIELIQDITADSARRKLAKRKRNPVVCGAGAYTTNTNIVSILFCVSTLHASAGNLKN